YNLYAAVSTGTKETYIYSKTSSKENIKNYTMKDYDRNMKIYGLIMIVKIVGNYYITGIKIWHNVCKNKIVLIYI
ncbi:MAG: hypothetical protein ACJ71A_11250, partial [Nitrososphaeraceae archaeon]